MSKNEKENKSTDKNINSNDNNLKELSNDEANKVAELILPILQCANKNKWDIVKYFWNFLSKNVTQDSAEKICENIIKKDKNLFEDPESFKKKAMAGYIPRQCKTGFPTFANAIKSLDYNTTEIYFKLKLIFNPEYKQKILSKILSPSRKKYLLVDYANHKISTCTEVYDAKREDTYYINEYDILNLSPVEIYESYNILDENTTPTLCFSFYRRGMPSKQIIKGDDVEVIEKQLAKRSGIVLKPREYKGVLNEIIADYISKGLITIKEEIPVPGIFKDPKTGKLCYKDERDNTTIKLPSKESVKEALDIWRQLYEIYPGDKTKLSHIIRYGLLMPFSFILKTEYSWRPVLFLYGVSRSSKTTLAEIALSPYTPITDDISIGEGGFDTKYRIGNSLSKHGYGVIVNEPSASIEKTDLREVIKNSVDSRYCREIQVNGVATKIPAYSNIIFTSNNFIPTHDAFVRRSQYIEFTKKERLSKGDIKKFNDIFHHNSWNNTEFLKLRAIGKFIIWYVSENMRVLDSSPSEIVDSMLNALLEYIGEDKSGWKWIYKDTEVSDISAADNNIVKQFRRMVLKHYRDLTRNQYFGIDDESMFKELLIRHIRGNHIEYLHYQKVKDIEYIIVNTSVKEALFEFNDLQVTCKGLSEYLNAEYTTISYNGKPIKGFRLEYNRFKEIMDGAIINE